MSSTLRLRNIFKTVVVRRIFNAWSRSYLVNSVVRRCRRDRSVREMFQCFRHLFFRPKQTLFLTVAATSKKKREGGPPKSCNKNITDAELQALVNELDNVEVLAQKTLYCTGCMKRITLNKKQKEEVYCACKNSEPPAESYEGWVPYMEAEDVIIWRKEYKPGKGLYAYKVYGRYKDIRARDFAAIQVDGGYRRVWDTAVAALSIVERDANGVRDQAVLHWEVLWPRLFANRDYVYIRRHKEFDLDTKCLVYREAIFNPDHPCEKKPDHSPSHPHSPHGHSPSHHPHFVTPPSQSHTPRSHSPSSDDRPSTSNAVSPSSDSIPPSSNDQNPSNKEKPPGPPYYADNPLIERINVHSKAKRKALELERMEREANKDKEPPIKEVVKEEPKKEAVKKEEVKKNEIDDNLTKSKVYVIISKSCTHSQVPVTKNAIRVTEYWSRMVIKTTEGPDKPGTEFVLTYYDEPAVGGMPPVLASFATARGAPAFLARMRQAAIEYRTWLKMNPLKSDAPDFMPFGPEKVSYEDQQAIVSISEEEMESSKQGPDLSNEYRSQETRDQGTQTEAEQNHQQEVKIKVQVKVEQTQANQKSIEMCEKPQYAEKACQVFTDHSPPGAIQEVKQNKTEDGAVTPERVENVVPKKESEANDEHNASEEDSETPEEEEKKTGWYRYLYPFYYFV